MAEQWLLLSQMSPLLFYHPIFSYRRWFHYPGYVSPTQPVEETMIPPWQLNVKGEMTSTQEVYNQMAKTEAAAGRYNLKLSLKIWISPIQDPQSDRGEGSMVLMGWGEPIALAYIMEARDPVRVQEGQETDVSPFPISQIKTAESLLILVQLFSPTEDRNSTSSTKNICLLQIITT